MISCLLLVLGVGSSLAGVSIQMPYLHPAGVTYAGYSAAVPAVPNHLYFSDASTSSVAHGNGAFLGRQYTPGLAYAAAPVSHVAAPVAHYAAPVVPTVHHVPAVAQVPVTNYEAQPAVIQNLVDVAKAKVASRKIEIRRPAIEKQFYDVEERVIIRPAGSAVVELDQPVSKGQKGPTVVQPAVHTVSAAPFIGIRAYQDQHHYIPTAAHPSVHYPIHGVAATIPYPSTPALHQEFESQPEQLPEQQQTPPQSPLQPELEQFPQQNVQPESPQQQFPQQIFQQEPERFDDSDSVAVDNPDIARARSQQLESQPRPQEDASRRIAPQPDSQSFSARQQELIAQFQEMTFQNAAARQQGIARSQVQAQEQVVAQLQSQAQAQQAQLQRSQEILAIQRQELDRSRQAVDSFGRMQQPQSRTVSVAQPESTENESARSAVSEAQKATAYESLEAGDLRRAFTGNFPRSTSPETIPSIRLSPEESLSNQERLISLLTGRGGVVEARSNGQPIDGHQVRARVLSVTPAPEGAAPREEKVNTRRVVVSRPIQTVEEVNVVEPFTKIERVAVHSPALIKTARHGVAHVPTSLPVHGYAHAISPTPFSAYY